MTTPHRYDATTMIDIAKQVTYWRTGAEEDWAVARELIERGRTRHGLFFAHLALEKLLKAHVCHKTKDVAPKLHNLVRLAEIAGIRLSDTQLDVLAEMNAFSFEGRYPEPLAVAPNPVETQQYIMRAGEVFTWLMSQL